MKQSEGQRHSGDECPTAILTFAVVLLGSCGFLLGLSTTSVHAQDRPAATEDTARVDRWDQDLEGLPPTSAAPLSKETLAPDRLFPVSDTLDAGIASVLPDTGRASRYLPSSPRRTGRLFDRRSPLLGPRSPTERGTMTLDSTSLSYILERGDHADGPMSLDSSAYRAARYRANLDENWNALIEQRQQQQTERGGLGVNMTVPGGRESAFTTVFGKPQVDLRVNGQAGINAGFEYSKNDRQGARTGDPTQLDPTFKQDLRLGITGTIGDKLRIDVDWDTESQFDYQNQVRLEYTGYDDEIIQSVEAGNVFLETTPSLIRGGKSQFGIKSKFQFGNLSLTTIASQKEGQANEISIEGGSEEKDISPLRPTDYEERTHFFLGYYFRNNWNRAHRDPTVIRKFNGFREITDVEVWKLQTSTSGDENAEVRSVAALVDLGEPPQLLRQADEYRDSTRLMSPEIDQYETEDLEALRDDDQTVSSYVEDSSLVPQPLQKQDWQSGNFKKLEQGRDYQLDKDLGFVSLKQGLRPKEALAVSFRYRIRGGEVRQVGDFTGEVNTDRIVLKLLRPPRLEAPGPDATDEPAAWYLELRNIYRIQGRGFTADNFEFDIEYNPSGQSATRILSDLSNNPLLQVLGLDRVDDSGAPSPDNEFDFTFQTINPDEGRIIFPYLQPFGNRILHVAAANGADGAPFAFENLYVKKKSTAQQEDADKDVYQMSGTYKGQAKGFYDLKAFTGLVEGSVEVTAGGQSLEEGTDYVVDYQSGTVNITNDAYLADGQKINISYEQQSIESLQKKTLLGARANWNLRDQFSLGATVMRLSEQSPVDKYQVGEEPIKNTIWGVDGSMEVEPQWLTEAVDALPLVETRSDSRLEVQAEFAQLHPGHTKTDAFKRTVDRVGDSDQDSYASDERNGVSYIDDFEGFENTFSLREQPSAWQVSAAPDSIGLPNGAPGLDAETRTWWRGSFGWYQLNEGIREDLDGKVAERGPSEATEVLDVQEVFDRDTRGSADQTLRTLDMYFDPRKRGPYNTLNEGRNLVEFFRNPKQVWGGVTRQLPEGFTDFSVQNVEFVEFIVKPYPQDGGQITEDAQLHVNLGTISEDVVPNERLNTEDGLALSSVEGDNLDALSRLASIKPDNTLDVRGSATEDLGLDGLVSYTDSDAYGARVREANFYESFLRRADSLRSTISNLSRTQERHLNAEVNRILEDPSADDYHHYENDRYFADTTLFADAVTLQERFARYRAGYELNSFEGQSQLAEDVSVRRGVSGGPDTEDLGQTGGDVNTTNNYYRYSIPLDALEARADTNAGPTDYVVSKVGRDKDWYKVRIPVREFEGKVGNIEKFTRVESMRMWTTGHQHPITMRFASLELVGSQWRSLESEDGGIRVASINTEEDPNYEAPVGAIVSQSRTQTGAQQQDQEQSLLLSLDELGAGGEQGVFKTFQGLDLRKYSNLRMYTHVHGSSNREAEKENIEKNLRLFVRLGDNAESDYYEYERPLTASNVPGTEGADFPWREENEMNLVLSELSQLKTARNQGNTPRDSLFARDRVELNPSLDSTNARLKIRGTPSLRKANTMVVGIRHAGASSDSLENVEVWVNELRVSGFDEESGWATRSSATLELADLASITGNFRRSTSGFGGLSSTLNNREQKDRLSWQVGTDVNLDALLPEQQGWSIPVSMSVESERTEPEFDQNRGDIRVSDVQEQTIRERFGEEDADSSTDDRREAVRDSIQRASESYRLNQSLTANLSKQGSESWWVRNTVDATNLDFSYSNRSSRSPGELFNDQWRWSGGFTYRLSFGSPRSVRPLSFLPDAPVVSRLSEVDFFYVPSSLKFGADARRQVTTRRSRPSGRRNSTRPVRVTNPFEEDQNFKHTRNFSLQYDPFNFLQLSFDTNTQQNLNSVSSRTQQNLVRTADAPGDGRLLTNIDTSAFFDNPQRVDSTISEDVDGDSLRALLGESLFVEERLRTSSEREVFQDLFFGSASPRTESYGQRLSATLRIGILDRKALDWIDVQDLSYQSSFDWNNGGRGSLTGAQVSNSVSLQTGTSLKPNKVWQRFRFFKRMKQAQQADGTGAQSDPAPASDTTRTDTTQTGLQLEDLPLPDPLDVLRGLALTFMDIKDVTVNYNGDFSSNSSNVGRLQRGAEEEITGVQTDYSILDALLRGEGAPLGYRVGLSRSIDFDRRVFEGEVQVSDKLQNRHQFDARTALTPSSSLNIDLNWQVSWSNQTDVDLQRNTDSSPPTVETFEDESGDASASVWAFGSYQSLFEKQLSSFEQALQAPSEFRDARNTPLKKVAVASDFREAYLIGGGTSIGGNGFAPFPMPGWTVRYSGLSDWPFIESVTERVSLNHSYSAEYKTGFSSVSTAGDSLSLSAAGQSFNYVEAQFEPRSAQIQKRFQPLIGVDITWPFEIETSFEWSRRTTTALRGTNIAEQKTSEVSGKISYSTRGITIPFFTRLDNRFRFSLTVRRSVTDNREFLLSEALRQAQSNPDTFNPRQALEGDNVNLQEQTTNLSIAPQIRYNISNRVNSSFELDYEKQDGGNNQASFTRINGTFSLQVTISEN